MKKKILLVVLAIILVVVGYFVIGLYGTKTPNYRAIYMVPKDAIYIIETEEPIKNWKKLSSSKLWKHLQTNAYFAELTSSVNGLDSLIQENSKLFDWFGSRKILISAHMYKYNDYDFLYTIDLEKASKLDLIKDNFGSVLGADFEVSKRNYEEHELTEIFDKESRETITIAFHENLMVCSYTHTLVEASLNETKNPSIGRDLKFTKLSEKISGAGWANFYFNHNYLNDYLKCYTDGKNEYVEGLSEAMRYTASTISMNNNLLIELNGYTNLNDSIESHLTSLAKAGSSKRNVQEVLPQNTAFYLHLNFDEFERFFTEVENNLKKDEKAYQDYKSNVERIEGFFDISLKKNFIDWIDDEIAFVQTRSKSLGRENEFAVFIKAKSVDDAKEELNFITERIQKKSPIKFKSSSYRNYPIKFMSVKGVFRVLLGKFFSKLEKPYYTYIDDFVVFANHPQMIKEIIDDYENGNTLDLNTAFNDFNENFNQSSSVFAYINTPSYLDNLKPLVSKKTWQEIQKNKDYFNCFEHVGLQLVADGDELETNIYAQYTDVDVVKEKYKVQPVKVSTSPIDSLLEYRLIDIENKKEMELEFKNQPLWIDEAIVIDLNAKKHTQNFENGNTMLEVETENGLKNGSFKEYYESGELKVQGRFINDLRQGKWKFYNRDGDVVAKVRFKNGKEQ